jgi:hypothetical protein
MIGKGRLPLKNIQEKPSCAKLDRLVFGKEEEGSRRGQKEQEVGNKQKRTGNREQEVPGTRYWKE